VKIFAKGKYLSEEQFKEFLDIWNYQQIITAGIKSKIVKSEVFNDKFQATKKEVKEFYDNEIFKRIIHVFNQDFDGFTVPLFKYSVKNKRHIILTDSKGFLKDGCIRNLKWAKTFARFDPKLVEEIQCIIESIEKIKE
jgi:hypothetical protein